MSQGNIALRTAGTISGLQNNQDANTAFAAVASKFAGASAPSASGQPFAYQPWIDTSNRVEKRRNSTNSAWLLAGGYDDTLVDTVAVPYTVDVQDFQKLLVVTGTGTVTLDAGANLGAGFHVDVQAGNGAVTLDPSGAATIDGATTVELAVGQSCRVWCDGTNFRTVGRAVVPGGSPTVRQAIQTAVLDANGYCNAISAGSGLTYNVTANASNPYELSFAGGFNAGPVNLTATITASSANQAALSANNVNYLFAQYVSPTTVTYNTCLVLPQYGYTFDRTQGAILNFEGADASTTILDDFGNTWTANGNAQIDTAQAKFGSSSLLLDGTGDYVETTNITSLGGDSWEISCWARFNALPGDGTTQYFFSATTASGHGISVGLNNTAGTIKIIVYASSDGSSHNVINGGLGTATSWATVTWYKIRIVFDALAGTYRVYLSNNGAAETQDYSASSSARICAIAKIRVGIDGVGGNAFNGWIDAFRFIRCATKTSAETPSASAPSITNHPVHFFSIPEMKMYEVTAASTAAGTNPTLTARNRLFLGEADTGAASVSVVRNYAVRGEHVSVDANLPATGSRTTVNHNIGTTHVIPTVWARNQTSSVGNTPGQIIPLLAFSDAAGRVFPPVCSIARNSIAVQAGDQANPWTLLTSTGAGASLAGNSGATFKYFTHTKRSF